MNQSDIKEIARIEREHKEMIEKMFIANSVRINILKIWKKSVIKKADYFEKEEKLKLASKTGYFRKSSLTYDKKQFLKEAGVEEK